MPAVCVSIGSNIDRERHVPEAVAKLRERYGALMVSSVYESDPIGFKGDRFYNLVVIFHTDESPSRVVRVLRDLEVASGRRRGGERFSARSLDLDLLFYGEEVIHEDGLSLPSEEIFTYAFVLRPLAEIAPQLRHPVDQRTYAELWAAFDQDSQPLWIVDFNPDPQEMPLRAGMRLPR